LAEYGRYPFNDFGKGLNLRDKPDAVDPAECIDALNVLFGERGKTGDRPGYDNLTSSALTNRVASLEPYYTTAGTRQLLAGCGTRLEAISTAGAVVDSETGLTNAVWDFARFGQPNAEVAYAGNGTDTLRKWSGTEWTAPTATVNGEAGKAMPKAGSVCVDPNSNRLFCTAFSTTTGGPNGLTSSPSHGYWSEPGNPEAYESTAFAQFTPGDGEKVQRGIVWKEFTFVFKETKFFVVGQTGTDGEGKPEFDYRPVEGGAGLVSPRAVASHPSGVYFMARNGVYRTTGQEAELISGLIEPVWSGDSSPFYTGGTLAHGSITNCAMGVWEDRIYLAFPTTEANSRVLVYDPQYEWWSLYAIPASCLATFRTGNTEELVFGYASGENHIGRHSPSYSTDDGAVIKSHHRSGWFDLENPDEKTIRASKVWGTGTVEMGLDSDFIINAGDTVELDMSGATGSIFEGEGLFEGEGYFEDVTQDLVEDYRGDSEDGTVFSVYLASEGAWSVHRIEHLVREIRNPATAE
jgi:hypothetical protein